MRLRHWSLTVLAIVCLFLTSSESKGVVVTRLQHGENLKIAAIGTSLSVREWFGAQLPQWFNTLGPGQVTMINSAIGGSASSYGAGATNYPPSSTGVYDQLPTALAHHPDVLFIEFAINDAYLPYMVSKAISKANLKTMIDMTLANGPNTEVVVQTMNNCLPGSESAQMRPELADYYQGYRDVISKDYSNNPRVLLIDNYPSWVNLYQSDPATWNKCVPDGIHPSGEGTALITIPNIKAAMLAQATPEPSTLVLILCGTAVLLILGSIKPRAWWRNDQKTGSQ